MSSYDFNDDDMSDSEADRALEAAMMAVESDNDIEITFDSQDREALAETSSAPASALEQPGDVPTEVPVPPGFWSNPETPATAAEKHQQLQRLYEYKAAMRNMPNPHRPAKRFFVTAVGICPKWGTPDFKKNPIWGPAGLSFAVDKYKVALETQDNGGPHYHILFTIPHSQQGMSPISLFERLFLHYRSTGEFFGNWNVQVTKSVEAAQKYLDKEDKDCHSNFPVKRKVLQQAIEDLQKGKTTVARIHSELSDPVLFIQTPALMRAQHAYDTSAYRIPLVERLAAVKAAPYAPSVFTQCQIEIMSALAYVLKSVDLPQRNTNFFFSSNPGAGKSMVFNKLYEAKLLSVFQPIDAAGFEMTGFDDYVDVVVFDEFTGQDSIKGSTFLTLSANTACHFNVKGGSVKKNRRVPVFCLTNQNFDGLFINTQINMAFRDRFVGPETPPINRIKDFRTPGSSLAIEKRMELDCNRVAASFKMIWDKTVPWTTPTEDRDLFADAEWDEFEPTL